MAWNNRVSRRNFARGGLATAVGALAAPAVSAALGSGATSAEAATVSATNSSINGQSGWSVPSDWGVSWRAKLAAAKAGTGSAVVAVLGDSLGFGYWSSDLSSKSWPELVRADLITAGGNGGSGFQGQSRTPGVMYNAGSGVPTYYKTIANNVWGQSTGGWTNQVPPYLYGPGVGAIMATTNGAQLSNSFIGSKLGVWYLDGGAPFSVQIDGTTVTTITPGSTNLPLHAVVNVPSGLGGTHSWKILGNYSTSAGLGSMIAGIEGINATGVRLDNFSFPGLYGGFFANQDSSYLSGTYVGGWRNPADLIIYELSGNDVAGRDPAYPNGTPADVWAANIQTYLSGVMNNTYGGDARGTTDVVLLFPPVNITGDTHNLFNQYKSRALGIGHTYGAAVIDLNAAFKTSWNAWQKAGYAGNQTDPTTTGSDFNHPSDKGHAYIAAQLKPLLTALS